MSKLPILAVILIMLGACAEKKKQAYDFQQIKEKGELTIITMSSSTSYFIYKD